jgi:hypothetical protein
MLLAKGSILGQSAGKVAADDHVAAGQRVAIYARVSTRAMAKNRQMQTRELGEYAERVGIHSKIYAAELLRLRRRVAMTTPIPIPRPTSVIAKVLGSGTRAVEGTGTALGCCANMEAGTASMVKKHALAANLELMSFILISPDELF